MFRRCKNNWKDKIKLRKYFCKQNKNVFVAILVFLDQLGSVITFHCLADHAG